ncbi:MAG: tetratricopeptide repeat protein [Candidatus Hodarchaeota archaeon]
MTANAIKALFEQGKYQAVVDHLAQWEADGVFDTFTEQEQIECIYYKSAALYHGLRQYKAALQIILVARQKYTASFDRSLLLALIAQQIFILSVMERLEEAQEVITEGDAILESLTAKERETGAYWIAFFEHRKGDYYESKRDLNTAVAYYQRALALREKIGNLHGIIHSLHNLGRVYVNKGEYDTALTYYQRKLDLVKPMGNLHAIAFAFTAIGIAYDQKGQPASALNYYQQALSIYEEIGSLPWIAYTLGFIVGVQIDKGELDNALEYNQRQLSLAKKTKNSSNIANCFFSFAQIYYFKGELDTALDYIQQALAFNRTIGESYFFFRITLLSASIYRAQGKFDNALECLQQCLNRIEATGSAPGIAMILFDLVRVVLDQKNYPQAQEYLTRLQQLQTLTSNKWIHLYSRLAEALVLKQRPRLKEKIRAQIILEQIVQEEVLRFELTALAIIQLCELLLVEVKLYGEPDVWKEAKALINRLHRMAQDQHSVSMSVEALLLRAKVAVVDGNLPQALDCYEQARLMATEKNLIVLLANVDTEQKSFEAEFEMWQQLIQSNVSLQERVNHARIENHVARFHIIDLTSEETKDFFNILEKEWGKEIEKGL